MEVVIITGMSGAGRSRAADWFEDQGYYCVDNMPPALINNFLEMASSAENNIEKAVFVADLRSGNFFGELIDVIDELRSRGDIELTVLYMEAAVSEIVRRYNEVRRNHPLTGGQASASVIEDEHEKLREIRKKADLVLDTSNLKLPEMVAELDHMFFGGSASSTFAVNISSFGFKYGIPTEADVMFDVRFLPNPFYVPSLKKLTGNNKKVKDYIFKSELAGEFVDSVHSLLISMVRGYINEGKYHLNIAFGCTGGHHRSVAIANAVAEEFKKDGMRVRIFHRDMDLQNKKR
ncbi:MAG: RNase adapter RapZ [Mogibacterium sp.]|nr:RNase adapter RapZ [Mogibacterium sp.]MBQ6501341.1 RNase adapter RapZ [Mogibacterium sp.]